MRTGSHLRLPRERIVEFCHKHHIRKLSLFGSVLRDDFGPDSDVDVLVEFEPGHSPSMLRFVRMEQELTAIMGGRKVDLITAKSLSRRLRDQVLATAEIQYAEG